MSIMRTTLQVKKVSGSASFVHLDIANSTSIMATRPVIRQSHQISRQFTSFPKSRPSRTGAFSSDRKVATQLRTHRSQPFSACSRTSQQNLNNSNDDRTTHFGFQTVKEAEKEARVRDVFSSVASSYDTMNDLMSLGVHRLWKDHFVRTLDPGNRDGDKAWTILDVAGGTGDIAFRMLDHATNLKGDLKTKVIISDINPEMLAEGKKRSLDTPYANTGRLEFVEANAQSMPHIASNSIDLYTVAFGIRNFTDKQAAINEAFRILKPGGVFACLEFSQVDNFVLNSIYKRWSFGAIPLIGQLVAGDRDSYQYLVESIDVFPDQETFKSMIQSAGFEAPGAGYENLTGGIAAIHRGVKPV